MKYKVGDKVKIKTWEDLEREYGIASSGNIQYSSPTAAFFVKEMERELNSRFCDRVLTIMKVTGYYYLMEEMPQWTWSDYMIEGLEKNYYTIFDSIEFRFELIDFD